VHPSYADYRPKTNAVILLDRGHIKVEHLGGTGQGKETKNLKMVGVLTYRNEYSNLKLAEAMGCGLGRSEKVWLR
jgi:hypothetical protein